VENLAQLRRSAINQLNQLPPHRLVQALDFINYLLEHPGPTVPTKPEAPRGSLEDLLTCTSIWRFEPGELEEILQDIEQSRLMELEETYDNLSA
jgi:hypothetical protein